MIKILKLSFVLLLLFNIFFAVSGASAEGLLPAESGNANCPLDPKTNKPIANCGNYSLNDMAGTAAVVAKYILGIVGSLALLALVAGGLMWMLSAGNQEWVTRGKQTIIGAVVGLVIVFASFMIIQLVFTSLGIDAKWNVSNWF